MPQHVGMQRKRHKGNNVRIPHSGECGAGHIPAIGGRDNISAQVWCIKQDGSELVRDRNDPVRSFSYAEYSYYIEQYKSLLTKFVLNESIQSNGAFESLADKSPLKLCGYTVSQERGLTQEERENILYEMISSGIVSKPEAMQYIEWFIHFNGGREINHLARSKWESDLSYVRNLNLANQPNQKIDTTIELVK